MYDQHKFAQGRDFEKYVKKLFPDGIDLSNLNYGENIKETQNLIRQGKTILEECMVCVTNRGQTEGRFFV